MRTRPANWPPAVYDEKLAQQLRDIGAGLVSLRSSEARRHHFVPRFWLKHFSPPEKPKEIFRIGKGRGAPKLVPVKTAAQRERLYSVPDAEAGGYDNRIEGLLALIENEAAPAFHAIIEGRELSSSDTFAVHMLLGVQMMRGPHILDMVGQLFEGVSQSAFEAAAHDRDLLRSVLQDVRGGFVPDEKVGETQQAMQALLDAGGHIQLEGKRYAGLQGLIDNLLDASEFVARADKLLVTPSSIPFVFNDVGFARHEDGLVFPLRPDLALVLVPPADPDCPRARVVSCSDDRTRSVNLRLYAWAEDSVFGSTQSVLASLRAESRSNRSKVRRPAASEHPYLAALRRGLLG